MICIFILDDGVINVRQGHEVKLDIYGIGLHNDSEVKLTSSKASPGHACKSQGLHVQVVTLKEKIYTQPFFNPLS